MAVAIPFPLPATGFALNSKVRINLDFIIGKFNEFNTGFASWDQVVIGTANSITGQLSFYNDSNGYYLQFLPSESSTADQTYTFPTARPSVSGSLHSNSAGQWTWEQSLKTTDSPVFSVLHAGKVNASSIGSQTIPSIYLGADATSGLWQTSSSAGSDWNLSLASDTRYTFGYALFSTPAAMSVSGGITSPQFNLSNGSGTASIRASASAFSDYTLYLPINDGNTNQVLTTNGSGLLTWNDITVSAATRELDNLTTTNINTHLLVNADNAYNLGDATNAWKRLYLFDAIYSDTAELATVAELLTLDGVTGNIQTQLNDKLDNDGDSIGGNLTFLNQAAVVLREQTGNGTEAVTIQAPAALGASYTLTLPVDDGNNLEVLSTNGSGVLSWTAVTALGGANTALSNLASVAINTTLVSDTNNTDDLGTTSIGWRSLYLATSIKSGSTTLATTTELGYLTGVTSAIQTQLGTKASTALSNLASVAINTTLVSDTDNTDDLGTSSVGWRDVYLTGSLKRGSATALTVASGGDLTVPHDLTLTRASVGGTVLESIINTDNTSAEDSKAKLSIAVGGGTTIGDPMLNFLITGVQNWTMGVDNSDSDAFLITTDSSVLGTTRFKITTSGQITQPSQPCFLAQHAGATDVTGDGTGYTVTWGTERFDIGSNFASNTFTAPVTGKYYLSAKVTIGGILVTHTVKYIKISTSNRDYFSYHNYTIAQTDLPLECNALCDMDSGDTATVVIQVDGSTKVVDTLNSLEGFTYFSGSLIN